MGNVLDHPLGHQEIGELGQAPPGKRQSVLGRPGLGDLLDLTALRQRELRRPPARIAGVQRIKPVGVEVVQHVPHPVLAGKASLAICGTLIPCADHGTICARRQVTTDPLPRRTIRISRLPSSSSIRRTRTRPAIPRSIDRSPTPHRRPLATMNRANLLCYGTSSL